MRQYFSKTHVSALFIADGNHQRKENSMYAIAVNGSPRKGGNTEFLLNRVLEPLAKAGWETELVQVGGQNIPGSVYWNMGSGRDKGEVEKDAEGLGNMKNLGQVIAWLGQAIQPHVGSFPALETVSE